MLFNAILAFFIFRVLKGHSRKLIKEVDYVNMSFVQSKRIFFDTTVSHPTCPFISWFNENTITMSTTS